MQGKTKAYQVKQVLLAIDKLKGEDNEHVGLYVELPSLSWLATTAEEAIPEPLSKKTTTVNLEHRAGH
ncbi:hypothetical protein [Methylomonas albis]|nr:hypothetical protein [Methylomonas albis]